MISKFSVKKPYTVIVAVVLVIILGIVSFTKMTTDLLPSMELPYAIVMTTYQGASPETVETTVTKPVQLEEPVFRGRHRRQQQDNGQDFPCKVLFFGQHGVSFVLLTWAGMPSPLGLRPQARVGAQPP